MAAREPALTRQAVEAVWRIEAARLLGGTSRRVPRPRIDAWASQSREFVSEFTTRSKRVGSASRSLCLEARNEKPGPSPL